MFFKGIVIFFLIFIIKRIIFAMSFCDKRFPEIRFWPNKF